MTRIVLDLDRLVAEGKLSAEEAIRLATFSDRAAADASPTGPAEAPKRRTFANVVMIFGALAVALAVMMLQPRPDVGGALGVAALVGGWALARRADESWKLLASALVIGGALGVSAAALSLYWSSGAIMLVIGLFLAAVAFFFRNSFVGAFAPLALGSWLGSGSGYWHASYSITITQPLVTVLVFSAFAAGLFWLRSRIPAAQEKVVTVMARVSFFLANFGFWIGSLWGDDFRSGRVGPADQASTFYIPDYAFSIGWALALLLCLWIGLHTKRRFISNTALTFLGIHFYTQVFESLGANPLLLLVAGISLIAVAFGLLRFDAWQRHRAPA